MPIAPSHLLRGQDPPAVGAGGPRRGAAGRDRRGASTAREIGRGLYGVRKVWHAAGPRGRGDRRGSAGAALHGRTADARRRAARRPPRATVRSPPAPTRPAARPPDLVEPGLHRRRAEPAVGRRLHLRADLVGDGVHRVRHRRVLPPDRRLAHRGIDADRAAAGRPGDGAVDPRPRRRRTSTGADPPLRRRHASTPRSATPTGSPTPARSPRSAPSATRYDNALAESVIGLYKTECVRRDGPCRTVDDLELATLTWVHWFNDQPAALRPRLLPPDRVRDRATTVRSTPSSNRCRENRALH